MLARLDQRRFSFCFRLFASHGSLTKSSRDIKLLKSALVATPNKPSAEFDFKIGFAHEANASAAKIDDRTDKFVVTVFPVGRFTLTTLNEIVRSLFCFVYLRESIISYMRCVLILFLFARFQSASAIASAAVTRVAAPVDVAGVEKFESIDDEVHFYVCAHARKDARCG